MTSTQFPIFHKTFFMSDQEKNAAGWKKNNNRTLCVILLSEWP